MFVVAAVELVRHLALAIEGRDDFVGTGFGRFVLFVHGVVRNPSGHPMGSGTERCNQCATLACRPVAVCVAASHAEAGFSAGIVGAVILILDGKIHTIHIAVKLIETAA